MKNTGIVIASLVGGMIIGSALTMLFTPQSGAELRKQIKDLIGDEVDKVREKVDEVRGKVETVYDVARAAKEGYEWLTDKFLLFMKLREMRK